MFTLGTSFYEKRKHTSDTNIFTFTIVVLTPCLHDPNENIFNMVNNLQPQSYIGSVGTLFSEKKNPKTFENVTVCTILCMFASRKNEHVKKLKNNFF